MPYEYTDTQINFREKRWEAERRETVAQAGCYLNKLKAVMYFQEQSQQS